MSLLPGSTWRDNWRHLSVALRGALGGAPQHAGVQLLDPYDPGKRPLILLHGLFSSPMIWARLAAAIQADEALHARFQVWQVLHHTNVPMIVARRRVQDYLDSTWRLLDPQHRHAARKGLVLVGHSFGGVVARLLCVDSGTRLWDAAFVSPPERVAGDHADIRSMQASFIFNAYPGITHAIFLAAPHRGSPRANDILGNLARRIVGHRTPEARRLRRVANADPSAVQPALRALYRRGWVNSITSMVAEQPVRLASEALMPRAGIVYHTIAGAIPGRVPRTDGAVPVDSAVIDGAASTLILDCGHQMYNDPRAVEEVLRILREIVAREATENGGFHASQATQKR